MGGQKRGGAALRKLDRRGAGTTGSWNDDNPSWFPLPLRLLSNAALTDLAGPVPGPGCPVPGFAGLGLR